MYDRILVPADDRDVTRRATAAALKLAGEFDATIHAIHVINERAYESLDADSRAARDADGFETLTAVRTAAPASVTVETTLCYGIDHAEILTTASETGADVIVIGSRRRSGTNRLLAGSVAELVVRHATVPVLTVGPGDDTSPSGSPSTHGVFDRLTTAFETVCRGVADALAEPYRPSVPRADSESKPDDDSPRSRCEPNELTPIPPVAESTHSETDRLTGNSN